MWEPQGKCVDTDLLGMLRSSKVLYEFEGEFLTYLAHDRDEELLLVHSLSVLGRTTRYLVAAIDSRILTALEAGQLDLRSALQQPRCWIADLIADLGANPPWRIDALYRVRAEDISDRVLPVPGTMLTPDA